MKTILESPALLYLLFSLIVVLIRLIYRKKTGWKGFITRFDEFGACVGVFLTWPVMALVGTILFIFANFANLIGVPKDK